MAEGLDPKVLEFSEHLLAMGEEERKGAGQALNQLLLAGVPDDEVGRPPVRTLGEYLDTPIPVPPMLVEPGVVARGSITALVSRGGKGKTALSLNRLVRWSMGKPLFDELPEMMRPVEPLRILLIENEGNGGHFQRILGDILHKNEHDDEAVEAARENLHVWGDGGWSGLKLDRDDDLALVDRATRETEAHIVFVEPFRGLWTGDEQSSTDMANVLDSISAIANTYGCGAMLTHHERKTGAGEGGDPMNAFRGSTAMEAAAAVMERWVPVKGGRQRELSCVKNRFDEPYDPFRMEFVRERWGYRFVTEEEGLRAVKGVLLQFQGQTLTVKDIQGHLEERSYQKVLKWLNQLASDPDQPVVKVPMGSGTNGYRIKGEGADPGDGGIGI